MVTLQKISAAEYAASLQKLEYTKRQADSFSSASEWWAKKNGAEAPFHDQQKFQVET